MKKTWRDEVNEMEYVCEIDPDGRANKVVYKSYAYDPALPQQKVYQHSTIDAIRSMIKTQQQILDDLIMFEKTGCNN